MKCIWIDHKVEDEKDHVKFLRLDDAGEDFKSEMNWMMNNSGFDEEYRDQSWTERFVTATYYENMNVKKGKKIYPIESLFKERLNDWRDSWGLGKCSWNQWKIRPKPFLNEWKICIFVGYSVNHSDDVHRLLIQSNIIISINAIWLIKSYWSWITTKGYRHWSCQ
jgi:hypothetical protein